MAQINALMLCGGCHVALAGSLPRLAEVHLHVVTRKGHVIACSKGLKDCAVGLHGVDRRGRCGHGVGFQIQLHISRKPENIDAVRRLEERMLGRLQGVRACHGSFVASARSKGQDLTAHRRQGRLCREDKHGDELWSWKGLTFSSRRHGR